MGDPYRGLGGSELPRRAGEPLFQIVQLKGIGDVPSSAVKKHPRARAYLTVEAARTLMEFAEGGRVDKSYTLSGETVERLRRL